VLCFSRRESASPAGLNDGTAFGIFASDGKVASGHTSEDMWSQLQQRELRLAVTHPPVNIFEEMILWTNQGKLWNFPINNEQGKTTQCMVENNVNFDMFQIWETKLNTTLNAFMKFVVVTVI
jgi:small subunit ribosomal protein S31